MFFLNISLRGHWQWRSQYFSTGGGGGQSAERTEGRGIFWKFMYQNCIFCTLDVIVYRGQVSYVYWLKPIFFFTLRSTGRAWSPCAPPPFSYASDIMPINMMHEWRLTLTFKTVWFGYNTHCPQSNFTKDYPESVNKAFLPSLPFTHKNRRVKNVFMTTIKRATCTPSHLEVEMFSFSDWFLMVFSYV